MQIKPVISPNAPAPDASGSRPADAAASAQRVLCWSGAVFLFVMPFTSSVALRSLALAIALAAGLALAFRFRDEWPRLPRGLLAAATIWTFVCAASWLWSVDPAYTASELRTELMLPLIAFGVFWVGSRRDAVCVWGRALLVGAAALGALALGEFALTGAWDSTRLNAGVGAYSTWLVMVFPLVLVLALPGPSLPFSPATLRWPLFALLMVFVAGGAYLTQNRIVWPALAAVLFAYCALSLLTPWVSPGDRRRLLIVGGSLLLGLVILFLVAAADGVRTDLDSPDTRSTIERDPRISLWRYTADRVAEAPVVGHGFGRGILRGAYQTKFSSHLTWHAHNVVLNVLLQTGVVGLAAFVALLASFVLRYVAYVRAGSAELGAIGIVGMAFLAGFLVKNFTDDFLVRHTGLLFWSMNAMLIGYGERLRARLACEASTPR